MGVERFRGESAPNAEMKCLCVLVIDVSGSMEPYMSELNSALYNFFEDIEFSRGLPESTKDQLEICLYAYDEDVMLKRNPCLLKPGERPAKLVERGGVTNSVEALRAAIKMVDDRKEFYKDTGQPYYRPWIIFMTDGEPYPFCESDIANLERQIMSDAQAKKYHIMGLGVGDSISEKTLMRLTNNNARKLRGTNFGAFFNWLSHSMSIIVSSKPGDKVKLPKTDGWGTEFEV